MAVEGVLNLVEKLALKPLNKNFRKTFVKLALKPPSQSVY